MIVVDNKIGDEGGKAIREALKTNTSLTKIDVDKILLYTSPLNELLHRE